MGVAVADVTNSDGPSLIVVARWVVEEAFEGGFPFILGVVGSGQDFQADSRHEFLADVVHEGSSGHTTAFRGTQQQAMRARRGTQRS